MYFFQYLNYYFLGGGLFLFLCFFGINAEGDDLFSNCIALLCLLGYTGDDRICCSSYLWYLLPLQKIPLIFIEVMDIVLFTFTNSLYLLFMCESVLQESFWGDGE